MMKNILRLIFLAALFTGATITFAAQTGKDHSEHDQDEAAPDQHSQEKHNDTQSTGSGKSEDSHAHDGAEDHDEAGHDEAGDDGDGHDEDGHGAHDEGGAGVKLSSKEKALAEITVAVLNARVMDYQVYAPGEIKANGYTSYLASPRVDSVVLRRHVALGDQVQKGQPLVTLFSETVAEAQAAFRVARSESKRVKKLGRKAVGDKRFVAAEADYEASYGRLRAYGLTDQAIKSLDVSSHTLGEYTLIAANAGAVLSDDFNQGQRVESGQALMELADEKSLWVEARLAPTEHLKLPAGTEARIKVGGDWFSANVSQEAHTIDPRTRTRVVRLTVMNQSHRLHPGLFADVYFSFATDDAVLAVPEGALMRGGDGDWTIFVEQAPGQYKAQEVELGRSLGTWREISGIRPGSRVVMEGAFFVASQIAKGGFDPHNH